MPSAPGAGVAIEPYLRIRSAGCVGVLPSGRLGYVSNLTGHAQLWQVAADGLHDQLTFGEQRVTAALPSPVGERWLVARDEGGDERHALAAVGADGGALTPLTCEPGAIHRPGAFSPDGLRVAFTHTARNGVDFDVATVGIDGGDRRELARAGGWCSVLDWSADGILLTRANTPFDHDLLLVDADGGGVELLTPHASETAYAPAVLLADGRVLCACDAGSQYARLALLERDGRLELLTDDDADVEAVATDRARRRRAWVVNRDGWSELWIDGSRVEGLPPGVYGTPWLGERDACLTVAGVDDTADVWALPGPRRRTRSPAGGLDRRRFVAPRLETFASFDGLEVPYLRWGEPGQPTVCHVHGGPESQFRPPDHQGVVQYLVARGIAVAAPNVRGSTGYGRDYHHLDDVERRLDSVTDLAALARALGAERGVPVAVMGGSYGGYMTLAAITEYPHLFAAAVDIVGIVNFVSFLEHTGAYRRALREAEYGSLERDRELLERISPIRKVDEIVTPLMVVHGANDPRVPVGEAEQVVAALRARGAEVEYLRYADEGHGLVRLANRLDCYPRIAAFLERHLGVHGA